ASGYRSLERRLTMLQNAPLYSGRTARYAALFAFGALGALAIPWKLEAQQAAAEAGQAVTVTTASGVTTATSAPAGSGQAVTVAAQAGIKGETAISVAQAKKSSKATKTKAGETAVTVSASGATALTPVVSVAQAGAKPLTA